MGSAIQQDVRGATDEAMLGHSYPDSHPDFGLPDESSIDRRPRATYLYQSRIILAGMAG